MNTVCTYLGGVHRKTILRYIDAGMPVHRPITGGRYLFDLDQVDAWIVDSPWSEREAARSAS